MWRKILLLLLILSIGTIGLWQISRARRFQFFGELVYRVETADSLVALTFDDGPSRAYTDTVLAILRDRDVKATFFVTGRESKANPDKAARITSEGHELANHTYSHPNMIFKSPSRIREEVERTDRAIRQAGHRGEIYVRPPYAKKLIGFPWYLSRTNRTTIMWDIEPESYREIARDAERIVEHVIERVRPGSIILLHVMYESRETSREALPGIIDRLREQGYRFTTVSELIGKG